MMDNSESESKLQLSPKTQNYKHQIHDKITSKKYDNIIARMPSISLNSEQLHKHSAAIIKNGIYYGYNHFTAGFSCHAEISAIINFYSGIGISKWQYFKPHFKWKYVAR